MDRTAIEPAVRMVAAGVERGAPPTPAVVTLLVREYVARGDLRLRQPADAAIARGLAGVDDERDPCERMQWIRTFAETAAWCEDAQLHRWAERALPSAVDALEAFVRRHYEPGDGLVGRPLAEHLRCALSLLAGFDLTSRLPYAMLAEELLQSSRRAWWDEPHAEYPGGFAVNCRAVRLLCGLAALRGDPEYARRAVVAPGQSYRDDAARAIAGLAPGPSPTLADAAEYGVALLDWFALDGDLH